MPATSPRPVAGDLVTAQPWSSGHEMAIRTGIVVNDNCDGVMYGIGREYVLVWFRSLGPLSDAGGAYQPILRSKLKVTGHITHYTRSTLERIGRAANLSGMYECAPLYRAALSAIKTKRA